MEDIWIGRVIDDFEVVESKGTEKRKANQKRNIRLWWGGRRRLASCKSRHLQLQLWKKQKLQAGTSSFNVLCYINVVLYPLIKILRPVEDLTQSTSSKLVNIPVIRPLRQRSPSHTLTPTSAWERSMHQWVIMVHGCILVAHGPGTPGHTRAHRAVRGHTNS